MQDKTENDDPRFARDHIYSGDKKEPYLRAGGNALLGLIFAAAGIMEFFRVQKWETQTQRGVLEMNEFTAMLYKLSGKWGILVFMLLLGVFFIYRGYSRWRRIKTLERL